MSVATSSQSNVGDLQLYELPDACIVSAVALTTPKDACRIELVAPWCRPLASSDDVWASFLPADYRDILSRSPEGLKLLETSMSKKELFLHICDHPLVIDDGTKSFTLDKVTGKKQFMLSAKALSIWWGGTPDYWKFLPHPESRFSNIAELIKVCWLELLGVINTKMLSPNTKYEAYLVFVLKSGYYGFEHPAEVSVGLTGNSCETKFVHLDPEGAVAREAGAQAGSAKRRSDGWMECKLGEMFVKGDEDADIEMRMNRLTGGNWKSGLCVEGIEIRPVEE